MKTKGLDRQALRLIQRMAQHPRDLGGARRHRDLRHQRGEILAAVEEARGLALAKSTIVNELHVKPAMRRRRHEHPALKALRQIPRRLAAHRRVEREDQPAVSGHGGRALPGRAEKLINLGAGVGFWSNDGAAVP
ncbi:hypothetical protein [Methylocella tundrae]|uniref:hypothetical protein n=1 Tax=Methylocella tundrae TaxID=227605 RepID=UPI00313EB04A